MPNTSRRSIPFYGARLPERRTFAELRTDHRRRVMATAIRFDKGNEVKVEEGPAEGRGRVHYRRERQPLPPHAPRDRRPGLDRARVGELLARGKKPPGGQALAESE